MEILPSQAQGRGHRPIPWTCLFPGLPEECGFVGMVRGGQDLGFSSHFNLQTQVQDSSPMSRGSFRCWTIPAEAPFPCGDVTFGNSGREQECAFQVTQVTTPSQVVPPPSILTPHVLPGWIGLQLGQSPVGKAGKAQLGNSSGCPYLDTATTSRVTSWALPSATMSFLQQCYVQGHVLRHCQVPPCPSPVVAHPVLRLRAQQVPHPGSHPWTLSGATTSRVTSWDTARCRHISSPVVSHPGSHPGTLPGATTSLPSSVTSRVTPRTLPGATTSFPRVLGSLVPWALPTLPAGSAGIPSGTPSRGQVTPRRCWWHQGSVTAAVCPRAPPGTPLGAPGCAGAAVAAGTPRSPGRSWLRARGRAGS